LDYNFVTVISIPENSACVPIKKDCDMLEDGMSSLPSSGSRSNIGRKLGSDSSPYRSISAGEESDSDVEDENSKPRGYVFVLFLVR
jgi:hypothetical protein